MPECRDCGRSGPDMRGFTRVVRSDGTRFYCSSLKACRARQRASADAEIKRVSNPARNEVEHEGRT